MPDSPPFILLKLNINKTQSTGASEAKITNVWQPIHCSQNKSKPLKSPLKKGFEDEVEGYINGRERSTLCIFCSFSIFPVQMCFIDLVMIKYSIVWSDWPSLQCKYNNSEIKEKREQCKTHIHCMLEWKITQTKCCKQIIKVKIHQGIKNTFYWHFSQQDVFFPLQLCSV